MCFPIDHDLHCHTLLSSCSADPNQTVQAILDHAKAHGYTVQCVTDHLWDSMVPGASDWYAPQDIEHIKQNLPLPRDEQVHMLFGCETEYCGGKKLGLHPAHFDLFDMIVIPPNHFHMKDFVRPSRFDTEEKVAELLLDRLEELTLLDLPWRKVGIAHLNSGLTFREGDIHQVMRSVDEARFRAVAKKLAMFGAGIELNCGSFPEGWQEHEADQLRLFRIARDEGCRFYLATDAHHPAALDHVPQRGGEIVKRLGLEKKDLWLPEA